MHVKWASQNNRANVGQYRTDEVPRASAIRTSGDLSKGGIESGNIPLSDIPCQPCWHTKGAAIPDPAALRLKSRLRGSPLDRFTCFLTNTFESIFRQRTERSRCSREKFAFEFRRFSPLFHNSMQVAVRHPAAEFVKISLRKALNCRFNFGKRAHWSNSISITQKRKPRRGYPATASASGAVL